MIRRPPRSTQSRSSAASDVYKRQVPLHHIFGSEELSRSAPAIAELLPEPYVALSPEDASSFGKEVELFGQRLPVKIAMDVRPGQAGVPAGAPPFAGLGLPGWSRTSSGP